MANTSIPKSLYRVYESVGGIFDYDTDECLFESDDLGQAHTLAYTKWKLSLRERAFVVIQPYDGSCRGHYGIKDYDYGDEE